METGTNFIFSNSKITAYGDCSHEIKRSLILGRKAMTNPDRVLKSKDIILPTKVCIVKPMVFPVGMHGCESWTIKKVECQRTDALNCGVGEDSFFFFMVVGTIYFFISWRLITLQYCSGFCPLGLQRDQTSQY